MKNYIHFILLLSIVTIGCYKDADNTPPTQIIIETSEVFVNTSISGSVLDINGTVLKDYALRVNGEINSIPSDYFLLELEDLKKKGQTIHVFKDDAQIGIRTQLLVENDINHMEILQHDPYLQKTISESDTKIEFTKSLSAELSNTRWEGGYTGQVTVDYIHIDASNGMTPVGYTSLSDLAAVDSKGGFYLSVKTDTEDAIIAQSDNPIVLKTSSLDESVNSLFVFDRENEIWVLVKEITSGDEVEILGEGYYTFANYTPGVFVEGKVLKEDKPVAYQPMDWDLTNLSNTFIATEKGRWIALLPEDESVEVNLLNPCDESLQTETLDIEVEDIQDQNLIIQNNSNYQSLNVSIVDCNGDEVGSPNLNVSQNEESVHYVFSSEYQDRWIAVCDEFEIAAINEATGEMGPELSWSTDINGGLDVLTDCDELGEGYSFIKIREDEKVYKAFDVELEDGRTILKSQNGNVKFIFKGMEKGSYEVDEVNVLINDAEFGEKGYYIKCENSSNGCGINTFNVTHYESNASGMVRVAFSGNMWMQTLSPLVAGNWDVEGVIVIKL